MTYAEIAEQVLAVQQQTKALIATTNVLLRGLQPLVEAEQEEAAQAAQPARRVFGRPDLNDKED